MMQSQGLQIMTVCSVVGNAKRSVCVMFSAKCSVCASSNQKNALFVHVAYFKSGLLCMTFRTYAVQLNFVCSWSFRIPGNHNVISQSH